MPLPIPDLAGPVDLKTDFLEFSAFVSEVCAVNLMLLTEQSDLYLDQDPDEIDVVEQDNDEEINAIIAEVELRQRALGNSYPFSVTSDGAQLVMQENWTPGQATYLFCLILSHITKSKLDHPALIPSDDEVGKARNVFQICATVGAGGERQGPSYSIGWPRPDASGFAEKFREIWQAYGDGEPHAEPPPGASEQMKDEGIDVIAWRYLQDNLPEAGCLLGQVASGNDWPRKGMVETIRYLEKEWFHRDPVAPLHAATFIPFYLNPIQYRHASARHEYIIHRIRLPRYVDEAEAVIAADRGPIERYDDVEQITDWVNQRRAEMQLILT